MTLLVSTDQLAALQSGPDPIMVIDCRFVLADTHAGRIAYNQAHIPGAFYLDLAEDLSSPVGAHGGRHPLPDIAKLQQTLRQFGATADTHFVLYDAQKGAFACRAWWLLRDSGVKKVSVLDGGWHAWCSGGHPTELKSETDTMVTGGRPLQLTPGHLPIVDHGEIVSDSASMVLIDSREPARYWGKEEPIDPIAGHIPGAHNLPWQTATDATGKFLHPQALSARFSTLPQPNTDAKIVAYCGSGVTACVNIFAGSLCAMEVSLYPGSWSDWCSYIDVNNREARVATG